MARRPIAERAMRTEGCLRIVVEEYTLRARPCSPGSVFPKTAKPSQIQIVPSSPLPRLRKLCLSFPDTTEVKSWGEPTFRVGGRLFAMYTDGTHHKGDGRASVWLNCSAINQELMIADNPKRFFKPPYVGPYGWVAMWLDGRVSWQAVSEAVRDAYDLTAAKGRARKRKTTDRRRQTADHS